MVQLPCFSFSHRPRPSTTIQHQLAFPQQPSTLIRQNKPWLDPCWGPSLYAKAGNQLLENTESHQPTSNLIPKSDQSPFTCRTDPIAPSTTPAAGLRSLAARCDVASTPSFLGVSLLRAYCRSKGLSGEPVHALGLGASGYSYQQLRGSLQETRVNPSAWSRSCLSTRRRVSSVWSGPFGAGGNGKPR